ncbi:hypothetical protein WOLCODRAFT_145725 [Wolfiporia cocos MD-104 SS10]|uniref:C2H2-type domain-containing protein n=1 Tax=Wolfiporia cocos (strain MD-104) TaxID=742152 RepID=A0A2H3JEV3_WOLCO|nr:hypothetical protein WOLCODRAFT_145725 [Wolfiporia cocos MD-104 SS10]
MTGVMIMNGGTSMTLGVVDSHDVCALSTMWRQTQSSHGTWSCAFALYDHDHRPSRGAESYSPSFVHNKGSDHPPSHSLLGLTLPHQDEPSENTPAITVNPAPVAGVPDGMITAFRVSTYEPPPRSNVGAHELQNNSKMLFHVGEEDMTKLVERVPAHTSTSSVDSASTSAASNASLPTITPSLAHPVPAPIHTSSSSSSLLPLTLPVPPFRMGYPAPPPSFASSPSLSCTSSSSLSTGNCTSAGTSASEMMPETRLRQRNDSKRKRETYCMHDENLTIADQAEPMAYGIKSSTAQGQGNRIVHESGEKSPKRHRAEARLPLSPQKNREHVRTETGAGTMPDGGHPPVRRCVADLVVASRQRAAMQGSTVDERDVRVDATNELHRDVMARDERVGRISEERAATHWPSGRMAAEVTSSKGMAERHPAMVQDDQMTGGGQWLWSQRQTQLGDEHTGEWAATTEDSGLLNETNEVGNHGWPSQGWYPDESRSGYVHPSGGTFGSVQPDSDGHTFQAPPLRPQSPGLLASERSAALDRALFSSTIAGPSTPAGNEQQALAPAYSCEHASTLHHRLADADPLLDPQTLPDGHPLAHQREDSSRYRPLDLMQAHLLDYALTTLHSFELMHHPQPLAQPRIEFQLMDKHRQPFQPVEIAPQHPQLSARPRLLHEHTASPEPAEERSVRTHWTSDPRVRLHRVCTTIDVNGCSVAPGVVRVDGREGATAAAPALQYPHGEFSLGQTRADALGISSRTTTPMTSDRSRNDDEDVATLDASAVTPREVDVMAMDGSGAETDVIGQESTNTRRCAGEVDRIEVQTRGTAGNPCVVDAASGVGPGMNRSASNSLGAPNRVSTASRDSPNREITSVDSSDNENVHVTTSSRCQNIATVITKESGGVAATTRTTSTAHEVTDVDTLNEADLTPSAAQRPMLGPIPLPPPYPYVHAMGPYLTVPHPNAHPYAYLPHTGAFSSPPHPIAFHPSLPNPSRFHNVLSYPPPSSISHPHAYPHSLPFAYPPPLILPGRTPRTRPHDWAEVFLHMKKVGGFKPVRRAVRGRRPWVNATTDGDENRQRQDSFPDNGDDGAGREEAVQTEGIGQSVTSERTDGDNSSDLRNNTSSLVGLDGDLNPTARETEDTDSSSSADDEDLFDELFRNPKGEGERKEHHCPLCGRVFRLPNSLAIHLKWHWGATSLDWRRGLGRRGRIQERAKENSEARARELREEELREREWRLESGRETGGAAHDGYGAQQRDLEPSAIAAPICVSTFTPLTSPADVLFSSPAVANAGTKSSFLPPTVATAGLSLLSPTIRPPEASAFMMPIIAGAFDLGVGAPSSDAEGEEEGSLFGEDESLFGGGGGGGDRLCPPPSESFLPAEPPLDSRYKVPSSTITKPGLTPELTLTSTPNSSEDRDGVLRRCTHRRHEPSWSEQLFGSDSDEEEHKDEQGPSSPASNAVEDRNQPESGLSPLTDFAALQLFP